MAVEDPTKKQTEQVDPKVAEILGLEDSFDLDQEEYITLLREKMTELDMKSSQVSSKGGDTKKISESQSLLIDEFKRVKKLKGSTFTAPKKTVNADSFFGKKKEDQNKGPAQKPITDAAKLLPASGSAITKYQKLEKLKVAEKKEEDTPEEKSTDKVSDKVSDLEKFLNNDLLGIVKEIRKLTEDILSILTKQSSVDKKGSELFRRESEKKGKKSKEDKLESKEEKKGLGLIEKVTKPFTSIFDTIQNFIMNVLMGSLVNWLFTVLKNPRMLLKPVQGLIDGIVGFFNNVIQFIDNMVVQPVRSFIDTINSALNGFIDILNGALKILPGSPQIGNVNLPNIPEPPELKGPDITGERAQKEQEQKPQGPPVNLKYTGGEINQTIQQKTTGGIIESLKSAPVIQKTTGGPISAQTAEQKRRWSFNDQVSKEGGNVSSRTTSFDVSGLGPDKHLTALSTGEYVLKKGAADWLGGPAYLDGINKMFGGSEQRKVASLGDVKIKAMNTGGQVGAPPSTSLTANVNTGNVFSPTKYNQGTKNTNHIVVGNNPPKSYTLRYKQEGTKFTVKQINKIVKQGWNLLSGRDDDLIGVNPISSEGKSVLSSANVRNYFEDLYKTANNMKNVTGDINVQNRVKQQLKNVKVNLDKDAEIAYWYNQSYQTHYNDWRKKGISHDQASQMAASAATQFAISKSAKGSKGSWLPGSSQSGAPESLRNVEVESNITSPSADSPGSSESSDAPITYATFAGDNASAEYVNYIKSQPTQSLAPNPPPAATTTPGPKGGPSDRGRVGSNSNVSQHPVARYLRSLSNNPFNLTSRRSGQFGRYAAPSQQIKTPSTAPKSPAPALSPSPSSPSSRPLSKSSIPTKPTATPTLDPKLTPMQNWAKLHPTLASKVKPGQSGYDEIQKVISPSSPTAPKIDSATGNVVRTTTDAPAAPKIDSASGNVVKTTTDAPAPPKSMGGPSSRQQGMSKLAGMALNHQNNREAQRASEQRTRLGVQKVNGRYVNMGVSDKAVGSNPWWQIWNKKGATAERKKKQEALAKSLADRLNVQEGLNKPKSTSPTKPAAGRTPLSTLGSASATSQSSPSTSIQPTKKEDQRRPGETPMQQWARLFPDMAAQVRPGQSGYEEIAAMRSKSSPSAPSIDPATGLPIKRTTDAPPPPSIDPATGLPIKRTTDAPPPPKTSTPSTSLSPTAPKVASTPFSTRNGFGVSAASNAAKASVANVTAPSTAAQPSTTPIAPSNITSPTKPNIPGPPESKPNISMMPLPSASKNSKPAGSGSSTGSSTPKVVFSSFNTSEPSIVSVASIYNIWGM